MAALLPEEARAIFDVYVMLLGNDRLVNDTVRRIHAGNWAPGALRDTIAEHATDLRANGGQLSARPRRRYPQHRPAYSDPSAGRQPRAAPVPGTLYPGG
ncbi:MAG: hypothetical protein MZV65_28380 [Chromatiales bacterium]|nr:hypothetical protein [Chromatiales bacterium]